MLAASITFFVLAALVGVTMAILHFKGRTIPLLVGLGHGLLAITGLILLFLFTFKQPTTGILAVVIGIILSADLGGVGLITYALRGRRLPTPLLFAHALLALLGLVILVSVALTPP